MIAPNPSEEAYRLTCQIRAVRNFRPEALPADLVEDLLQAARWTGSSKNTQPWAFVVLEGEEERQGLARCGRFAKAIESAPLVVALVKRPGGDDFDIGRVAQNLMLAAAARGLGSCPVTLHDEGCVRETLAIPADHGCRYAVAIGYPEEAAERAARERGRGYGTGRRPLDELVSRATFSS